MPDLDEQQLRSAYDQFMQGNVDLMRERCTDDYTVHIPSLDMHVSGREQAFKALRQLIEQVNIHNEVERIESHGDFVVVYVSGSSDLRGGYVGVDVVRVDDQGRAVESYLHRNPLPPGTELPTG